MFVPDKTRGDQLLVGVLGYGDGQLIWRGDVKLVRIRAAFGRSLAEDAETLSDVFAERCSVLSQEGNLSDESYLRAFCPDLELACEVGAAVPLASQNAFEKYASFLLDGGPAQSVEVAESEGRSVAPSKAGRVRTVELA